MWIGNFYGDGIIIGIIVTLGESYMDVLGESEAIQQILSEF